MKREALLFFIALFSPLLMTISACSQTVNNGPSAVFVATTPCSKGTRPIPGIALEAECELIKWNLQLFESKEQSMSGTYVLSCYYGLPQQGTKGLKQGGKHLKREGKWTTVTGNRTNPSANVYRLDPDKPEESISFLKLNDNVIHLLDSRQQLMIGDGGSSYTLNRVK